MMKMIFLLLGIACWVWAGYSVIRFLFTVNEYTGFAWIISILAEAALGAFFIQKSNNI